MSLFIGHLILLLSIIRTVMSWLGHRVLFASPAARMVFTAEGFLTALTVLGNMNRIESPPHAHPDGETDLARVATVLPDQGGGAVEASIKRNSGIGSELTVYLIPHA